MRTRQAIVHCLKREGAMDAQALAAAMGVSAMAVRQHLYALQDEHLVSFEEEARAMGRPAKLWRLTPAADRFFPEGYAELTLGLLHSVAEAFGDAGMERLLDIRTRNQLAEYHPHISPQSTLPAKLAALAELRTAEGYMAEVQPQADGSFLLIEHHCPICAAATACTGLCDREQEVFQQILGSEVQVDRTEHIVAGARRCTYRMIKTT